MVECDKYSNNFSKKLRYLLKKNNMTQIQFGKIVDYSYVTVNSYINGFNPPSMNFICKTADYFDVSIDWLLGRDDFCSDDNNKNHVSKEDVIKFIFNDMYKELETKFTSKDRDNLGSIFMEFNIKDKSFMHCFIKYVVMCNGVTNEDVDSELRDNLIDIFVGEVLKNIKLSNE